MRLIIADDHVLFRDALVTYIRCSEPEHEILTAKDLYEAEQILENDENIDVALLDLCMPGMNGLEGLKKLTLRYPDLPIALMSGVAEREHIKEAIKIGIVGYFPKTLSGKAMLKALQLVMLGEIFLPMEPKTNNIMPSYFGSMDQLQNQRMALSSESFAEGSELTPRERTVLEHLMTGASNKDIARLLDLQVVTVKLHLRGICRKLGAKNRTHAALIAQQKGLFPLRAEGSHGIQ